MKKKKILIVSAVFPPEPVVSARLSSDIYFSLKENGNEVNVLHPKPTRPDGYQFGSSVINSDEIIAESYTCARSSVIGRFKESLSFGKATYRYIESHHSEISVIYANTWPLMGQYYLVKAAKKYNIPCIIHVQDIYPDSYCHKMPRIVGGLLYNLLIPIDKYVLRNTAGIIAISPAMEEYLSKSRGVDKEKFEIVKNWQDDQSYIDAHEPIKGRNDFIRLMYLGSINPTADVALIIRSLSEIDKSKYHLSVIGNGPEKEHCKSLASNLDINVTFDTVTPEEVAAKQSEADILILCLKKGVAKTATPSKLTAYMLTGRPIIASVDLDSDCANIIREAECGMVVEPGNEVFLREAIIKMASFSVDTLNSIGASAFEYAKNNLSKERNLNKLVSYIESISQVNG